MEPWNFRACREALLNQSTNFNRPNSVLNVDCCHPIICVALTNVLLFATRFCLGSRNFEEGLAVLENVRSFSRRGESLHIASRRESHAISLPVLFNQSINQRRSTCPGASTSQCRHSKGAPRTPALIFPVLTLSRSAEPADAPPLAGERRLQERAAVER